MMGLEVKVLIGIASMRNEIFLLKTSQYVSRAENGRI